MLGPGSVHGPQALGPKLDASMSCEDSWREKGRGRQSPRKVGVGGVQKPEENAPSRRGDTSVAS